MDATYSTLGGSMGSASPPAAPVSPSSAALQTDVKQLQTAVQQALQQQQIVTMEQHKYLNSDISGMQQLLQAQAAGIRQTETQMASIRAELDTQLLERPELTSQLAMLSDTHAKLSSLHQFLQRQLSKMKQTQSQVQQAELAHARDVIAGLYKMLLSQTVQLASTQAQVVDLQVQVQLVAQSADIRVSEPHDQVEELQAQVEARTLHEQQSWEQLQQRPRSRPSSAARVTRPVGEARSPSAMAVAGASILSGSPGAASALSASPGKASTSSLSPTAPKYEVRSRIEHLEEELQQLIMVDTNSDEEEV
jgi:hypothetical protein